MYKTLNFQFLLLIAILGTFQCAKQAVPRETPSEDAQQIQVPSGQDVISGTASRPQETNIDLLITLTSDERTNLNVALGRNALKSGATLSDSELVVQLLELLSRQPKDQVWDSFVSQVRIKIR